MSNALYSMTKAIHLIHRMTSDPEIIKTKIFDEALGPWDILLYYGDKGFFLSFGGKTKYREIMPAENMNLFMKFLENITKYINNRILEGDIFIDSDEDSSDKSMSYSSCSA